MGIPVFNYGPKCKTDIDRPLREERFAGFSSNVNNIDFTKFMPVHKKFTLISNWR